MGFLACLDAAVGRPLGWGAHFVRYIVAFNWSSVYVIGVMLPPLMLFDAGVIGGNMMGVSRARIDGGGAVDALDRGGDGPAGFGLAAAGFVVPRTAA